MDPLVIGYKHSLGVPQFCPQLDGSIHAQLQNNSPKDRLLSKYYASTAKATDIHVTGYPPDLQALDRAFPGRLAPALIGQSRSQRTGSRQTE
jgi:hypothetical protein